MPRDRNNEQKPKKMGSKDHSELSSINCVSTLQEINLLQNSRKPAKFCLQNHMNIHVLPKDCSEFSNIKLKVKLNGVSTLQENKIVHDSNPAKFCQQNHMNMLTSSQNNQSFYSISNLFWFLLQR